jgi:hypothetical protein
MTAWADSERRLRRRAILVLVTLAALGLPGAAAAGGPAGFFFRGSFSGGDAAVAGGVFAGVTMGFAGAGEAYRGSGWREDPATLIIDATPPDALVYLDGRSLATAGDLVARALSISLGPHAVHVHARGFRPRAFHFVADGTFPIRIRTALSPD